METNKLPEKLKNPKRVTAGKKSAVVRKEKQEQMKEELRSAKEKLREVEDVEQNPPNTQQSSSNTEQSSPNTQQNLSVSTISIVGIIVVGVSAVVLFKYYSTFTKKISAPTKKSLEAVKEYPTTTKESTKHQLKIDPHYME